MADDFRTQSFDEKASKKVDRAKRRVRNAKNTLPHTTEFHVERQFDEDTGKVRHKIKTDPVLKKQHRSRVMNSYRRTFLETQGLIHQKISENEKDNSAVEGAHKTEETAEDAVRFYRYNRRSKNVKRQNRVRRAERSEFKAEGEYAYKKYLYENPEIEKRVLQKKLQKERIKKEYARQFRKKAKEAEEAAAAVSKTNQVTITIARKLAEIAREHSVGFVIALGMGLFFVLIATMISSCGAMMGGGGSTVLAGAYQSLPADIDACEDSFKEKEMYLQNEIDSVETNYPDYDEYVYDLGHIGHNPFTLIGYLSATFLQFTHADVETEIQSLFDEMYTLTYTPSEETRTRTVTTTVPGSMPGEDYVSTEEEEYTVTILTVTLTVKALEDIVNEKMSGNDEALSLYETYGVTHGLLQRYWSPVDLDWMSRISCYYGYRVHPMTGVNQFHRGLDIAIPEGTELHAAMDGTVTTATYNDSYGNYVVITDENGYQTKYAHMQSLSVSAGQVVTHGDTIGFSGNTGGSTGPHLHLECLYNGEYYNPIFYFLNG